MKNELFTILLDNYITGSISEEECLQLKEMLDQPEYMELLHDHLRRNFDQGVDEGLEMPGRREKVKQSLLKKIDNNDLVRFGTPVHRIHFLKTAWFRYAAAIIIIAGISTYLWNTQQKEKPSVTQTNPVPVQNDVAPGGNRATLTLADGSKIILDNAKSGELAREDNATIRKTADGIIVYDPNEKLGDKILLNTMATPRGGQYQLTLPDGSQVWLNAESSITYPTAFNGNERSVTITGEAYFEITKDRKKPFKVIVEGKQEIEVLGTHFNVNAYKEEPTINTTLIEGSVRIALSAFRTPLSKTVHTSLILKPGQQGQLTGQKLSLAANPDIDQVMAWKNGYFNFDKADLPSVLRQLARWYDIDVKYEGPVKKRVFRGELQRNLTLMQVTNILKEMNVSFRLENRTLIVY